MDSTRMSVVLEPAATQEQLDALHAAFGDAYDFSGVTARPAGAEPDVPAVGERRASTSYGLSTGTLVDGDPPSDATWLVEEWDGTRWRRVGQARGDTARDRLLHER